jgi:hypothetical protein
MSRLASIVSVLGLAVLLGACGGGNGGGGSGGNGSGSGMTGGGGGAPTGSGGAETGGAGGADPGGTGGIIGSGGTIPDGAIFGEDGSGRGDATSDAPPVPLTLAATVDDQVEEFENPTVSVAVSTVTINGTRGGGLESLLISIVSGDAITGPGGTFSCTAGPTITYQKPSSSEIYYLANMTLGSCQITITDFTPVSVAGTFVATLATGGPEPTVTMTGGRFSAPR